MMELFLLILCAAACIGCSVLSVISNTHMFQLNSYQAASHFRRMNAQRGRNIAYIATLIIAALCVPLNPNTVYVIVFLWFAVLAFVFRPKKAKKPLVYTSRVKRLLFTIFVLTAIVLAPAFVLRHPFPHIFMCLAVSLSPLLVVVADFINSPVEGQVRKYYINDARKMLRSCPGLTIIGITGSYGKTSMKYFLSALLKEKYNVLMTPENFNTTLGIVRTVRENLRATHEVFVCEMGARHTGDIKEICELVQPHHGIITSIGEQHLETFKTIDNIQKTKYELVDSIPAGGMVFLNADNKVITDHLPKKPYITYGVESPAGFRASNISVSARGTSFIVTNPSGEECEYQTQLIGEHNVLNLVGAIAVSNNLGIPLTALKSAVKRIASVPHRLQLIESGKMSIIDDAYNSNPNGCKAALKALSMFDYHKILVTPGMVELGEKQDDCNYEFGRDAAKVCDHVVLVGEKQTRSIYNGLCEAGFPKDRVVTVSGIKEAMNAVGAIKTEKRKIVLLENDLPDNYA